MTGFVTEAVTMVSVPVADPRAVGSNTTFNAAGCPAVIVRGKLVPGNEKPAPNTVARLTETGEVADVESATVCVDGLFSTTSPKSRLVALTFSSDDGAPS